MGSIIYKVNRQSSFSKGGQLVSKELFPKFRKINQDLLRTY